MKLRLPNKLIAALLSAMSAATFATLATGTIAYADGTYADENGTNLGTIQFVGDSITHGSDLGGTHDAASWRWALHKIFVDNGITYSENGYHVGNLNQGNYKPVYAAGATYGGVDWENKHSAQASGRAYELITNGNSRYDRNTPDTLVQNYTSDRFFLLIGTNDTLSYYAEGGRGGVGAGDNLATFSADLLGCTATGDSAYTFSGSSRMDTIVDTFHKNTDRTAGTDDDAPVVVLSIPTWSPNHTNNNTAADFAAMAEYNKRMKAWAAQKDGVTYVEVNTGIVDVANTAKPGAGVVSMFNDGLHPSGQGDLIIAGNVAKNLGYAGRTAGLNRADSHTADTAWTSGNALYTINAGQSETLAAGAFSVNDGYTVDFDASFGNGATDNWLDKANALTIAVGDGHNTGALKLSEGYISWGDTILYSQDNSAEGNDRIRIAYHTGDAAKNVDSGYYVWLGDMLIGQALHASSGSLNGITLSAAGATGKVSGLTYSDAAYAPTTSLVSSAEHAFHATLARVMDSHNSEASHLAGVSFDSATDSSTAYASATPDVSGNIVISRTGTASGGYIGAVKDGYAGGSVDLNYHDLSSSIGILAAWGGTANGSVSVMMDGGTSIDWDGAFNSSGNLSFFGSYGATVKGAVQLEVNDATLRSGIMMGHVNGTGKIEGGTKLIVNEGALIGGNIYGGSQTAGTIDGGASITITGGEIRGSVYGGNNNAGTINDGTSITITGGRITNDVIGGNKSGGTVNGGTAVTVDGNKAYIGGNISADNVTFRNVEATEYDDAFDHFAGAVTATDTLTLNNYNAAQVGSSVSAQHVVLTGNSSTTIRDLTLTACTITAEAGSDVTLEGTLTLGNTATYTGTVYVADGLVFSMTDAALGNAAAEYTYSQGTSGFRTIGSATLLTPGDDSRLKAVGGAALTETNVNTYTGAGALAGATFSYNAETGILSAAPVNQVGSGTYYVNDAVTYDTNTPAYAADALVINNGGTLTFAANLKDNVSVTVAESGAAIGINEGKHIGGVALGDGVTGFALSGAGELRLTSADAATMLTGVTGTGTMRLTQNAVLNGVGATAANPTKTLSTGTLIVGNGEGDRVQMQIGRTQTGGQYQNNYATIKSFNNVVLDNGKLWYHTNNDNSALTLNNLTVTNGGGEIYIEDVNAKSTFALNGTTKLQGDLSLLSNWKDNAFVIATLTGDGNLSMGANNNNPQLQLNNIGGWSGNLTHTKGSVKYYIGLNATNSTANLSAFNVNGGTAQIRLFDSNYAKALVVDRVTLANNATMQAYYASWTNQYTDVRLEIGNLTLGGANATLSATNYGGLVSVGSITGTGTLTLNNTSSSDVHTTFILGNREAESAFSGSVVLDHANNGGAKRVSVVMLNGTDTMAQADLQVKAVQTAHSRALGVGVSADHVKLGGLNDKDIKSGGSVALYSLFSAPSTALNTKFNDEAGYFNVNDGTMRTLEITGSGTYSTGIRVMEGINLVMSGTGSQTFSGDMSSFNGNVAVNSGTLALTGTGLTLEEGATVNGGTLTISGTNTTLGGTITNGGTLNLSGEIAVNTDKLWNYEVKAPAEGNTYSDGANGYLENATMYLVKGNGGTLNSTASFTGKEVTNDGAGNLTFLGTDTATYYVNEALTYDNEKMGDAANLHIAKDASLTANGVPTSAKVLMGEGTFNLATVTSAAGVALPSDVTLSATDWQGVVHLTSNNAEVQNFTGTALSALGNSTSWVELENFKGYANSDTNNTITANLILNGENALTISNGYNKTYTFAGDIKGDGVLQHNYRANTLVFQGDISGWTGSLTKNNSGGDNTTVKFEGNATEINTTISKSGTGGFAIQLGNITNGASAYTFNKNVTAATLTPNGHVASISKDAVMTLTDKNANQFRDYLSNHSIVGEGKVVLTGGENAGNNFEVMLANNAATDKDILTHYEITGDVHFNGSGSAGAANIPKAVVTIGAADGSVDAGLKVTRDMRLGNYAHMKVSDNTYLQVVGKLLLGHNDDSGSYPGKLTINGGEVTLGSLAIQSTASSNSFVMNGGSLEFTGTGNIVTNAAGTAAVNTSSTTIQFNAGTLKATQSDWTLNHAATIGNVEINSTTGRTLTISNALSDADDVHGTITKTGAGKLTLSGANTFTGDLTIAEGTLEVGFSKALGALNNGHPESRSITVAAGGVLDIHGTGGFDNTDAGTYAVTLAGGKLTNSGNDVSEGSRQLITVLTVNNESTVEVLGNDRSEKKRFGLIGGGYAATSLTLNADLVKTGTGTFMLNRTNITGNGSLVVREGTVQFRTDGAHGTLSSNIVMDGGAVTGVDANSVFLGKDISITSTNSSSSFSSGINTDGHVLTLGGTEALTLSGAISGSGSLVKDGANTMTLSSANSFTGTTTIKHGTLIGANSNALRSSVVTFSDVAEDRVLSFENNGSAINGTIAGLSGYRGTVKADTLTINVAEGGNYQFLHRYSGSTTNDAAVLDVNKLVKQGAGTQVIGGEYTTARGFTDAGLVIANGVDVQGGSLHMKTRGVVTANFDVQAGATLLTTDDNANKTTAAASVKYDGKVTLHGTAENTATLNYADGSTNITNGLYVDGYGSVINKYDKNQFIGGLFNAEGTTSNDISFNRPDSPWDNTDGNLSAAVITASGNFTGTVHVSNGMVKNDGTRLNEKYGLQVLGEGAKTALAGAVVDFTGDNVSVLSFRNSDTVSTDWTNSKMDGSVAGLTGTNGAVYANTLTINTADSAAYTYGGAMNITGLTKTGTGTQTLSGTGLSLGTVAVNGGTLALTGTTANMAAFDSMAIANGATLDLTSVTGMFENDAAGSWAKFTDLASKATGAGTVLLPVAAGANDTYQIMVTQNGGNATLSTNYVMNHGVSFNNYNNYSNPGDNTGVVIAEGGSLTVNGALKLASGMKMTLNGGSLTANSLTLGHGDASQNYFGSVTMNSGAMTLNGQITAAYGYAGNALNLLSGTFTYNADGNVFANNNSVAVTIGGEDAEHKTTLVADGHSWTLNHDATLGHVTVQTANGGAVTIGTADTTTTLTGLIYNKGELTLAGTVNVVRDLNTQDAYFTNGTGDHTYGYLNSVTMKVIELSSGSSEHVNDVTWKLNGQTADWYGLSEVEYSAGLVLMQGPSGDNSKRWFMNTGAGATFEYTGAESQEMNSFIINAKNDAVLTLNTGDNVGDHLSGPIIVNDTTAAINIAAGTTLAAGKLRTANGGNAVLTGAGAFEVGTPIFDGNNMVMPSGVSVGDAEQWTGVVSVSGSMSQWLNGASLDNLGNANSWVEFKGISGVFNSTQTVDANIRFTDNGGEAAFTTTGGFSGKTFTFNGKVSGTGTYYLTNYNNGIQTFKFNGDASAWTGTLKSNNTKATGNQIEISNAFGATLQNEAGNMQVTFKDGAAFSGSLKGSGGTMKVNSEIDETAVKALYLSGGANMELSGGHYTIGGDTNEHGLFDGNGHITIMSGTDVTLNAHMEKDEDWQFEMKAGDGKGITIAKGSSFTVDSKHSKDTEHVNDYNLKVTGAAFAGSAIAAQADRGYRLDADNITMANVDVELNKRENGGDFANKLENSTFTNTGTTDIALTNSENKLVGVHAQNGAVVVNNANSSAETLKSIKATGANVTMDGLRQATGVTLNELVIGAGKTVSATNTVPAIQTQTADPTDDQVFANIEVTGTQEEHGTINVGTGGTTTGINLAVNTEANHVDYSAIPGNVLDINGGSLTLNTLPDSSSNRILLSDSMMGQLANNMMIEVMSGIGALTVNDVDFNLGSMSAGETIVVGLASNVFGSQSGIGFGNQNAQVLFRAEDNGTGTLLVTPEPTTTALSLLGLAGLAARRKRK